MLDNNAFLDIIAASLHRNLREPENSAQCDAVMHDDERILQVVAGPGSGKTTVLVLRALRFVFVDGILPENILITTFTKKAARELRTRWLDWGTTLHDFLKSRLDVAGIDLNRCRIETLDSIAQQVMTEYRIPGTVAPVIAGPSAGNLIFKRFAFSNLYTEHKNVLDVLFARYTFEGKAPRNRGEALGVAKRLTERLIQDRVHVASYGKTGEGEALIVKMLREYRERAIESNTFDFSILEEQLLARIVQGTLNEWLKELKVILIDEYQDTNPLQEQIYFGIIRHARPATTIVGDDDQSMYRFRGGSVELFTHFAQRCRKSTDRETRRIDMTRNFRSRPEIISFYNSHITNDPAFAFARIRPAKPLVFASRDSGGVPVLGMFRQDPEVLARDVSTFLANLMNRRQFVHNSIRIEMHKEGDLGDAVLLAHSVEEIKFDGFGGDTKERFAGLLRTEMRARDLDVFNPRGQALRSIPIVGVLLGLLLLSIDEDGEILRDAWPTNEAMHFLKVWRARAKLFVKANPFPSDRKALSGFIKDWQRAAAGEPIRSFPRDWPVLELVFKLVTWIPGFQRDPEHQVWLEAISRIIAGAGMASAYSMQLLQNVDGKSQGDHVRLSRLSLIRDALIPIAENEVDVDEDIMPAVPRNRLQLMTIHQAKGLEFPLVIVDVGSHFTVNHHSQKFLRFPSKISNVVQAEEDVEAYLEEPLRGSRGGLDRTFDDLVRLYYVAFSRPQSVLLLIGCEKTLQYGKGSNHASGAIPNMSMGWRRDGSWAWRQQYSERRPPVRVETPMELI